MSKVTVVGAGNVGATCANVLAFNEVCWMLKKAFQRVKQWI